MPRLTPGARLPILTHQGWKSPKKSPLQNVTWKTLMMCRQVKEKSSSQKHWEPPPSAEVVQGGCAPDC